MRLRADFIEYEWPPEQHLARMLRKAGLLRIAVVSKVCHAVVRPRLRRAWQTAQTSCGRREHHITQIATKHCHGFPIGTTSRLHTYSTVLTASPMNDGTEIEQQLNASETVSLQCLDYFTKSSCLLRWYEVRTKYMLVKIHTTLPCELDHPSSIKMSAMLTNSPASASAGLTKTNGYGTLST